MFWLRVEPTGPGCVQPGRSQQKNEVSFWIKTLIDPSSTCRDCQHAGGVASGMGEELRNIHLDYVEIQVSEYLCV